MSNLALGISAITCYLVTLLFITQGKLEINDSSKKSALRSIPQSLSIISALILHAVLLYQILISTTGINFAFFNSLTLFAWFITLLLVCISIKIPISKISLLLFPITIVTILLVMLFPGDSHYTQSLSPQIAAHILLSILAYGFLSLAALQAILLAIQDRQLHHHRATSFMQSLPPLQRMETILFQILKIGFTLLTAALISGFLFTDDFFSHKIIFSMIAWLVFGGLLVGRGLAGWRGRKAIHWTLIGISALLMAYFGSKLVIELILNR